MATLVIAVESDPDAAFDAFKAARRALANAVGYRRRVKGIDRAGWRSFAIAGALEVDMFLAEDFGSLGSKKREQYRALGVVPEAVSGPQWIATVHALVRVGALGDEVVKSLFQGVAPVVHLQALHERQTLAEAAEAVMGYAAKVQITTGLAGGATREWPLDALKDYIGSAARSSHGRQGFKLMVKPQISKSDRSGSSRSKVSSQSCLNLYPMPVIF